jgi:xanthine dehydrogenase accessory factor
MKEILRQLSETLEQGRPVAYCRLVETRGSTPQKPGALMLVYPDGSQGGTLGGGCVEAEVKRRALQALQRGQPEIASFQLDSDYGWDDGLICGGRMQILIEPLSGRDVPGYFRQLVRLGGQGLGGTEVVIFDEQKAGLPAPSCYLFDQSDRCVSTLRAVIEGDQPPAVVRDTLRPIATRPRPYAAHGMAYMPLLPRCRLLIVGGGHVGKAVADLAAELDFDVWVVDDREEYVDSQRFPRAARRIAGPLDDVLPALEITADTYCLIVTRGHNHDEKALYYLADRGARYVGMIGSRRKVKMILDDLRAEGVAEEVLGQVHAPVGLEIGSQTVPEIAVSIAAELIALRNCEGKAPGRGG